MSVPEWTPSPWQIAQNKWNAKPDEPWRDAIKIEGDVSANWSVPPLVCATYRGDTSDANAALIAAAPDLYEALEHCMREHAGFTIQGETRRMAEAAMAKARGEKT